MAKQLLHLLIIDKIEVACGQIKKDEETMSGGTTGLTYMLAEEGRNQGVSRVNLLCELLEEGIIPDKELAEIITRLRPLVSSRDTIRFTIDKLLAS